MASDEATNCTNLISVKLNPMLGTSNDIDDAQHYKGEKIKLDKEEWTRAVITLSNDDNRICIKLYNLGATRHISPYKSNFIFYAPLTPPIFLNTTNQQRFPAIKWGTLVVQVPNRGTKLKIMLHLSATPSC